MGIKMPEVDVGRAISSHELFLSAVEKAIAKATLPGSAKRLAISISEYCDRNFETLMLLEKDVILDIFTCLTSDLSTNQLIYLTTLIEKIQQIPWQVSNNNVVLGSAGASVLRIGRFNVGTRQFITMGTIVICIARPRVGVTPRHCVVHPDGHIYESTLYVVLPSQNRITSPEFVEVEHLVSFKDVDLSFFRLKRDKEQSKNIPCCNTYLNDDSLEYLKVGMNVSFLSHPQLVDNDSDVNGRCSNPLISSGKICKVSNKKFVIADYEDLSNGSGGGVFLNGLLLGIHIHDIWNLNELSAYDKDIKELQWTSTRGVDKDEIVDRFSEHGPYLQSSLEFTHPHFEECSQFVRYNVEYKDSLNVFIPWSIMLKELISTDVVFINKKGIIQARERKIDIQMLASQEKNKNIKINGSTDPDSKTTTKSSTEALSNIFEDKSLFIIPSSKKVAPPYSGRSPGSLDQEIPSNNFNDKYRRNSLKIEGNAMGTREKRSRK